MRKLLVGLLLAIASGVMYGLITVGAKAVDAPPLAKAAISGAAAAATLLPFAWPIRVEEAQRARFATMTLLGSIVAPIVILYGLESTSAAHAGLILVLELVVTGLLAFLVLRESVRLRGAFGLACLLAAAAVAAFADASGASRWWGVVLVAVSALAFAFDNFLGTTLVEHHRPHELIAWKSALAAVPLGLAWLLVDPHGPTAWWGWLVLVANGSLGVGLAAVVQYHALEKAGAARTTALNIPVSALAAAGGGWLLLGESVGWQDLVAVALVAGGIALLWDGSRRSSKAKR